MSNLTPKENTALDIAMTRLGQLVDRMEKASHPYPRERTWPDCEAELAQLRAEIERLREALRPMTKGIHWITYKDIDKAREALGDE